MIFRILKVNEDQNISLFDIGQKVFSRGHDTANTDRVLNGSEITCGKLLDDGILHSYLNYILKNM